MVEQRIIDRLAQADVIYANGVLYFIVEVNVDKGIVKCTLWTGANAIIDLDILVRSHSVRYFTMEELK